MLLQKTYATFHPVDKSTKVCATSDGVRNDNETGVHIPT
jgi:hypothetical protein